MDITLQGVTLPADLFWIDEFSWTPVEQATAYTLGGALIVEEQTKQAGRSITLASPSDGGWVTRAQVKAVYALAQNPSTGLALQLADGRNLTVVFNHDGQAVRAVPVAPVAPPTDGDFYTITIRLIEV